MNTLSVIIVAKNEHDYLEDCLKSVSWANEIILVDDGSTDDTRAIAKQFTDHIYDFTNNYSDFGSQKQFALSKATSDWVLSIDADERLSPELVAEVQRILRDPGDTVVYHIPYLNHFLGHPLKMACEQYSQPRLFRRAGATFKNKIHEVIEAPGPAGTTTGRMIHYSYRSVASVAEKFNRYTNIEAQVLFAKGYRTRPITILLSPLAPFLRRQFLLGGWKDGLHGLVLNLLFGYYYLLIQMKVWELSRQRSAPPTA